MLSMMVSCATATNRMNQGSSDVQSGVGAFENAVDTVDRAIATEKRIRERYK